LIGALGMTEETEFLLNTEFIDIWCRKLLDELNGDVFVEFGATYSTSELVNLAEKGHLESIALLFVDCIRQDKPFDNEKIIKIAENIALHFDKIKNADENFVLNSFALCVSKGLINVSELTKNFIEKKFIQMNSTLNQTYKKNDVFEIGMIVYYMPMMCNKDIYKTSIALEFLSKLFNYDYSNPCIENLNKTVEKEFSKKQPNVNFYEKFAYARQCVTNVYLNKVKFEDMTLDREYKKQTEVALFGKEIFPSSRNNKLISTRLKNGKDLRETKALLKQISNQAKEFNSELKKIMAFDESEKSLNTTQKSSEQSNEIIM